MRSFRPMAVAAWAALTVVSLSAPLAYAQDRSAQILANLKLNLPQLAEMNPTIGAIAPSGIAGLDQGSFTVNGRSYPFNVTKDNKKL